MALASILRESTIPIHLALIVLVVLGTIPVSSANRGLILILGLSRKALFIQRQTNGQEEGIQRKTAEGL